MYHINSNNGIIHIATLQLKTVQDYSLYQTLDTTVYILLNAEL